MYRTNRTLCPGTVYQINQDALVELTGDTDTLDGVVYPTVRDVVHGTVLTYVHPEDLRLA